MGGEVYEKNPVVVDEIRINNLAMQGHISNGGGLIVGSNGKAIKITTTKPFTTRNGKQMHWVTLQILEGGINVPIKEQNYQRTKKEIKKVIVKKEVKPKPVKPEHKPVVMEEGEDEL